MELERFETIINGQTYKFVVWGSGQMWSANAYDSTDWCIGSSDGDGSDDVILQLVKKIESNGK